MNIKITGAADAKDGYGEITQGFAIALSKLGHNVSINPIKIWYDYDSLKSEARGLVNKPLSDIDFELIVFYPVYDFGKINKKAAIITMYEAHICPEEWTKKLNSLRIPIFAPSNFVVEMFKNSKVTVPIFHVPLGIGNDSYEYSSHRAHPKDTFRFLTVGKLEPRKNIGCAITAFQEAFNCGEDVEFIVKTRERFLPSFVKQAAKKDHRIKIIEKTVSEGDLGNLFYYCDAFIYPSRGEGFSFPPRNAVFTGLPTVVTDWSALAEIPGTIKIPIKGLGPMPPCGFSYGDHNKMLMANIDEVALAHIMNSLYYNKNYYNSMATKAFNTEQLSWEEAAKNLVKVIEELK